MTVSLTHYSWLADIGTVWMGTVPALLLTAGVIINCSVLAYLYRANRKEKKRNTQLKNEQREVYARQVQLLAEHERLQHSVQQFHEMDATKDKFFSIIGHDLRSPLNTIIGFLKMLNDHVEAFSLEELKNFAQTMNKSVSNLLSMLDNLLQWSRSQSGIIEYKPREISVRELIDENIYLIVGHADSKEIRLNLEVSEEYTLWADVNMLNVILRNLLTNAVKFTRRGGTVSVRTYFINEYAAIDISDTGVGISKERLSSLFKSTVYQSEYGTAQEKGNGLGLILCHEFVQRNGGAITVESKSGEGTTFTVLLPRTPDHSIAKQMSLASLSQKN